MKKIIFAGCIITIVLLLFPLGSIAKGGKRGGEPLICPFEGNIEGLEFDFGKGFPLDLGLGFPVTITHVEVEASGQELSVVIPPNKFIYNADLWGGWDSEHGKIFLDATVVFGKKHGRVTDVMLEFQFDFATIFERFDIKKKDLPADCPDLLDVTVPKKENLYFEVTNAQLIGPEWLINDVDAPPLYNLVFVVDKGKIVLVKIFSFPPLPDSKNSSKF
ncbi:MAG: hypothetical protein P8X90_04550 [Desulfobacterales bacterium]|jgi:hypothetical protein